MPTAAIIVLAIISALLLFVFLVLFYNFGNVGKINLATQHQITDRDLLKLIGDQPDGLLSAKQLMIKTGMTKQQANKRLYALHSWGILQMRRNNRMESYYSLSAPLDERPAPTLSPEPFLTVNDLMLLFKHFDYQITSQQLVYATGLPWHILKHEIRYFEKKKIIQKLTGAVSPYSSQPAYQSFVLCEPYRSEPDRFLAKEVSFNLELKTLLKKEDLM